MDMNIFNNNRIVFWMLIFLAAINVAAFTTFYIYTRNAANEPTAAAEYGKGLALRQELSLTPEQSAAVNKISTNYRASSEPVVAYIREKKAELVEELSKASTDTSLLAKITDDIVTGQKKLQMANIQQFLELKKVCTPEQTQKLSQIYSELYGCENNGQGKGKGKGMRHRYGQQKNTGH